MNNCFIILAAGESKRFKSNTPKPYYLYRGKPLILHSIDKAKESNKFKKIVLVINKKHKKFLKNIRLRNVKKVKKPTDNVTIKIIAMNIFPFINRNINLKSYKISYKFNYE